VNAADDPSKPALPAPIDLQIPMAPTPVRADGATHLLYELHITNFDRKPFEFKRMDILGDSPATRILASYEGAELEKLIRNTGAASTPPAPTNSASIGAGTQIVVFLDVALTGTAVLPHNLSHLLFFDRAQTDGSVMHYEVAPGAVGIQTAAPIILRPPLRGKGWIPFDLMDKGHRRTLMAVDGKARIGQRFAADWAKLGPDGLLVHGSDKDNASYYSFGEEVFAVADAVVADSKDGIPLNVATEMPAATTMDNIAGNYLILDLGNGRFAQYAHLQPGSIRVKIGEKVHAGQVLALLGNSGNSNGPHLHFQVTDGPSFLGSEGLPYVFQSFVVRGVVDPAAKGFGDAVPWSPAQNVKPTQHNLEIPLKNSVIDFPETH
jgi:hypothetical protein